MLFLSFVLGTIAGSFVNVLIYRIPKGEPIFLSRSYCPSCKEKIAFYDNIPIVSFALLKGKCRKCGSPIPIRYPFVELLCGGVFLFNYLYFGFSLSFLFNSILISSLIAISIIDLMELIIPDKITFPTLLLGLVYQFLLKKPVDSVVGVATGVLLGFLIRVLGAFIFKQEAFGLGDIKLLACLGAFLGPFGVLFSLFAGSFLGSTFGIFFFLKKKKRIIPFGPFLSISGTLFIYLKTFLTKLTLL